MAEAASTFYSGFLGTAAFGANELSVIKWDINPTAKLEEFRNSRSGGWVLRSPTFNDVTGSIDVDYDFANGFFNSALFSLQPGGLISNMKLYLRQSSRGALDGSFWGVTSAYIDGTPQSLTVDGKIVTRLSWKGSGAIAFPS